MEDYFGEPLRIGDIVVFASVSSSAHGQIFRGYIKGMIIAFKGEQTVTIKQEEDNKFNIDKRSRNVIRLY